jgi:hypothetical protein
VSLIYIKSSEGPKDPLFLSKYLKKDGKGIADRK